jgi:glycosyltransferase involved in cell wall biosynthesis
VALLARSRPALELIIAGEGDLGAALEERARASGARVRLLGNQAQSEVARLLAAADVVAVPSIRDDAGNVDGLPNFALEALASGTPVVATTAGGLPQAITDGETGRLVPERDAAALAAAIDQVLASPDRGRALGAAARAHAVSAYGWDRVAARFEAAYDRAAASFLSRAGGRASV